ncbi:MAG: RHS repeat-associated core domain-containing protein [Terriglobia bacterium]
MTEPYPSGSNSRDTADYVYDILGRIKTASIYGNGTTQTRTFSYDPTTQRLTSVTHPESGTTSYTYNADGTVATIIDAKNQKLAYVYDSFGRVTQIQHYPVSSGAEETYKRVNYYYDSSPCANFTSQNVWGRVTAITGPSLNCITLNLTDQYFSYAAGGLVAKKRMGVINSYLEAQYTYNNEGQVTSLSYPGTYEPGSGGFAFGPTYNYYYDTMGRPNRMTLSGDSRDWVKDVVYGPAGEMTQKKYWYENFGVDSYYVETLGYNSSLQLTSLDARTAPDNYPQALVTQTYSYDLNGNVNQIIDSTAGTTVNYTYDNLNRLSTAATVSTAWGLSFTYDEFGNRTGQSVTKGSAPTSSLSISTTNNRITTSGYSYDNNGNLTAMPGSTMSYDIENRITQITGGFGTDNYKYGPDNSRLRKTRGTSIEHYYFYGAYGELLGVYAPYTSGGITYGNMTVERNVYFAGKLIRSKQTDMFGTVTDAAVVVDRLGSVRMRSNTSVSVYQQFINYPFGEESTSTENNREKFATYFRDKDTGLDYARNRYYGSTMGRFLTTDPHAGSAKLGNPQSWNRYTYAGNDPVNRTDPNGLDYTTEEPFDPSDPRNVNGTSVDVTEGLPNMGFLENFWLYQSTVYNPSLAYSPENIEMAKRYKLILDALTRALQALSLAGWWRRWRESSSSVAISISNTR